jgi:hypothetical protein
MHRNMRKRPSIEAKETHNRGKRDQVCPTPSYKVTDVTDAQETCQVSFVFILGLFVNK